MKLWKFWFFLASFIALSIALDVILDSTLALSLAFILALLKVLRKNIVLHNITEVLMYSGIAIFLVPVLDVFWGGMMLAAFSLYDVYAVWKSKHMIKMAKFQADSNLFAGQDKIKMVTHCGKSKVYDQYILQEYLTYKHYNILTENSFRVRLLRVNYVDPRGKETPIERYGFLIEDKSVMAKRNGMKDIKRKLLNQEFCDRPSLDLMTVFQYMIGNTDWSITKLHNIKLIAKDSAATPIPVPYDFDYSGVISTHYAEPPDILPIENVRQRIFRGYCRTEEELLRTFEIYNQHKSEIYALYQSSEIISEKNKKAIIKYFDRFYETINDSKRSKRAFNAVCRLNHLHIK